MTDHEQIACGEYKLGGISAVGILECDHSISDFSNASQYTAAIAAGKLRVIKGIKAEIPDPSPVDGEAAVACGPENELYTMDWSATITDMNVTAQNRLFYDALNNRRFYIVFYLCDSDEVAVVEHQANAVARLNVPLTKSERQRFIADLRWRTKKNPEVYDAPAGIF